VLVLEGDHVAAAGEAEDRLDVARMAGHDVRNHLVGTVLGIGGQHAQPQAERDRGGLHHPGQLTGADHADDRGRWADGGGSRVHRRQA
jgi:hypothetical protein